MTFILNKKDIIALNQEFEDGTIHNEPSLDYAVDYTRRTTNWIKALAFLTRAILIDHVFIDGNKRVVALLIKTYADYKGHAVYNEKLAQLIKKNMKNNITSIRKLEEEIKNVIK